MFTICKVVTLDRGCIFEPLPPIDVTNRSTFAKARLFALAANTEADAVYDPVSNNDVLHVIRGPNGEYLAYEDLSVAESRTLCCAETKCGCVYHAEDGMACVHDLYEAAKD